ncbi:MAG: xanthine dehydrogenase family protein molybdopterin-binding subunit, partial [Nitrospinota bacterium]
MLQAKVLRSPHAHARILNIRTDKAARVPGVVSVVTAEDSPGIPWGRLRKEQQILAMGKVRYVGEEVAAVAARSEEAALEGIERIEVDYGVLPSVFDPEEAMLPGAPEVWEGRSNIAREIHLRRGDVEQGFSESDVVHEASFTTAHQFQTYMEPLGAMAEIDGQGRLTLFVPTQSIFFTRALIAEALDLPPDKVRVVQTHIGGAFGGKLCEDAIAHICALLALKTGQPVRLLGNRLEEFGASRPRMPTKIYLKMGLRKDGIIAAKETRIVGNNGAYCCLSPEVMRVTATQADSLYRLRNIKTDAYLVYTNLIPSGAFRGFGNPQMSFAMESQLDCLAEKLGLDAAELRIRNVIRKGETSVHGCYMGSCGIGECIEKAMAAVGWKELRSAPKRGDFRTGVGLACAIHVSAARQSPEWDGSAAVVKVNEDGKAQIISGEGELGQGAQTVLAQVAAEELGLDFEEVTISTADTESTPFCFGGFASRLAMVAGNAVRKAARMCRDRLLMVAAEQLEVSPRDLAAEGGIVFVKSSPEKKVTFRDVVKANQSRTGGDVIFSQATWDAPTEAADPETFYGNISPAHSFVCGAVAVKVDIGTGEVRLEDVVAVDDVGRVLNPLTAEGQVHGGVAQGLGFGLYENPILEGGQFVNGNLADYTLPKAETLPQLRSILEEWGCLQCGGLC